MTKHLKRIMSLALAVLMVVGLSAVATGAPKVTGVEDGVFVATLGYSNDAYQPGAVVSHISQDFGPGDTINIYLNPAKFVGSDLKFTPEQGMSKRDLENAGIQLRTSSGKNSTLVQSVSFQEQTLNEKPVAYIQVKLVSNFTDTTSKDFETTISLYANKNKAQSLVVGGTLSNSTKEVATGDDYIYLGDGSVVTALDTISRIEVDTGNNISIFARMLKDRQYYAVSNVNPTSDEDIALMGSHPEMQMIVYLNTRGFDASNPEVSMKLGDKLFVYDSSGALVGKTGEMLPLSSKYYLTSEEIQFTPNDSGTTNTDEPADSGNLPGEDGDSVPEPDGDGSGGTVIDGGDSDIPNTGLNTGLKVAIGAGIVSVAALAVIGITSRKKKGEEE